jgi:hypothetical protein
MRTILEEDPGTRIKDTSLKGFNDLLWYTLPEVLAKVTINTVALMQHARQPFEFCSSNTRKLIYLLSNFTTFASLSPLSMACEITLTRSSSIDDVQEWLKEHEFNESVLSKFKGKRLEPLHF